MELKISMTVYCMMPSINSSNYFPRFICKAQVSRLKMVVSRLCQYGFRKVIGNGCRVNKGLEPHF